jgi:hypothetical protein
VATSPAVIVEVRPTPGLQSIENAPIRRDTAGEPAPAVPASGTPVAGASSSNPPQVDLDQLSDEQLVRLLDQRLHDRHYAAALAIITHLGIPEARDRERERAFTKAVAEKQFQVAARIVAAVEDGQRADVMRERLSLEQLKQD